MIYRYSLDTMARWTRGELQVQIDVPGRERPMGYCDGTDEDEQELLSIAEGEGVDELPIRKRVLKTGRQIWTVGNPPPVDTSDDD